MKSKENLIGLLSLFFNFEIIKIQIITLKVTTFRSGGRYMCECECESIRENEGKFLCGGFVLKKERMVFTVENIHDQ